MRIAISMDDELVEHIDEYLATTRKFVSRSHFLEVAAEELLTGEGFYEDED